MLYSLKCSDRNPNGMSLNMLLLSDVFDFVTKFSCLLRCLGLATIFRTADSNIDMSIKIFSSVMSKQLVGVIQDCIGTRSEVW
jgi:hypothetical protein